MRVIRAYFVLIVFIGLSACVSDIPDSNQAYDKDKATDANVKLGMSYLQQGERDRALRAFTKAMSLSPKSAEAMQGMALLHQMNGETELAEKKFQQAIKYASGAEEAGIGLNYARFLYEENRAAEAIKYLEPATMDISFPNRGTALYLLGLCAQSTGDLKRAEGVFQHAMNLSSKNALAAIELAEIKFEKREYSEAKKYLDIFAENARQSSRSLWLGIRIERIFGNKDKEASHVLALKNLYPYSKEYLEYKKLER